MTEKKVIRGTSVDDAVEQLTTDITWQESPNNYRATIHTGTHDVYLETVRSTGGGDGGSGFEQTTLTTDLPASNTFRFAIVPEDFLNKIGKYFGMQDVKLGYPEFDDYVLVRTNDVQKLKDIFADESLRSIFQNLSGFTFHVDKAEDGKSDHLHLVLQHALVHASDLRKIFCAFNKVLHALS